MKRLLPFLILLLLLPCMILPASATSSEDEPFWYEGKSIARILYNIAAFTQDIRDYLEDSLSEYLGVIGSNLHIDGKSITEYVQDVSDRLDWLDDTLESILNELYTNGALTIGEYVKGIRTYVVDIKDSLVTGVDATIGQITASIKSVLDEINTKLDVFFAEPDTTITDKMDEKTELFESVSAVLSDTLIEINFEEFEERFTAIRSSFDALTIDTKFSEYLSSLRSLGNLNVVKLPIRMAGLLSIVSFALFGRIF